MEWVTGPLVELEDLGSSKKDQSDLICLVLSVVKLVHPPKETPRRLNLGRMPVLRYPVPQKTRRRTRRSCSGSLRAKRKSADTVRQAMGKDTAGSWPGQLATCRLVANTLAFRSLFLASRSDDFTSLLVTYELT